MNEYVMTNRKLPGQPIIVHAWSEEEAQAAAPGEGWKLAKTDPDKVRDEGASAPEPAEPVNTKK